MPEAKKKPPANKVLFSLSFAGGMKNCRGFGLIMEKMFDFEQLSSVFGKF